MVSQLFEEKAKAVNELPTKPDTDELLKLYALYKQATVGDNTKEKPGIFNMKDRYKWDAWEELKGKSQDDAEKEYIEFVDELIAKYSKWILTFLQLIHSVAVYSLPTSIYVYLLYKLCMYFHH